MAEQLLAAPPRKAGKQNAYSVTLVGEDGSLATETMRAESRSRLRMSLSAEGRVVREIREVIPWWKFDGGGGVSARVLLDTTRQLGAFCEAGISILDALEMIADSTGNKRMAAALRTMVDDIRDGETLPQAARAHAAIFPNYYIAMLEAADRTGNLPATFETLAGYLERDTASRRAVKSALAYPLILVGMGAVAVVVLSAVVLPKFVDFFTELDVQLPLPTRMLLASTAFISARWPVMALSIGAVVAAGGLYARSTSGGYRVDHLKLRMPIVGALLRDTALERFCRVLSNLSAAGVPLVDALRLSGSVVGNKFYARAVESTRDGVLRGRGLADPMEAQRAFPAEVVQVVRVGEHTGRLTDQLRHAAQFYAREVDYRLKTLTALLEPFALLVVGGAVGFVAVALVSAMYGIYSATYVGG